MKLDNINNKYSEKEMELKKINIYIANFKIQMKNNKDSLNSSLSNRSSKKIIPFREYINDLYNSQITTIKANQNKKKLIMSPKELILNHDKVNYSPIYFISHFLKSNLRLNKSRVF